jgi:hypothetical protein
MQLKIVSTLLALAVSGSLLGAQAVKPKTPPKEASVTVTAQVPEPALPIRCTVVGLTKEKEEAVKAKLAAMKAPAYVCDACKVVAVKEGACTKCKAPLVRKDTPLMRKVTTLPDEGVIILVPDWSLNTRVSDVVRVLDQDLVKVNMDLLPIGPSAELHIGDVEPMDVENIHRALKGLFADVKPADPDGTGKIRFMVTSGNTPPTHATVVANLTKTSPKAKLIDVIYVIQPTAVSGG